MNNRCDILTKEECLQVIRKKLNQESMIDFSIITYELETRNVNDGALGIYFNLKARVANLKSPEEIQVFNFFVKISPSSGTLYNLTKECECYKREISFYNTILPNVLIPKNDEKCTPDCYLVSGDYALVLEDISSKGYITKDKSQTLDFDHCIIVMKNLAWFHAKSIIFEEERKTSILQFCQEEKIPINTNDTPLQNTVNYYIKNLMSVIDLMQGLNDQLKEKYKAEIMKKASVFLAKIAPSEKYRNVLCHFDLGSGNILFRYDANGKLNECCFIDFQWVRYGIPVLDILFFLNSVTTSEFRNKNSQKFYKMYYDTFFAVLKEANIDASTVFSWENFLELIDEMKIDMLIYTITVKSITALRSETQAQHANGVHPFSEICCKEVNEVKSYQNRMFDLFFELFTLL